jgi:hypothetical protein
MVELQLHSPIHLHGKVLNGLRPGIPLPFTERKLRGQFFNVVKQTVLNRSIVIYTCRLQLLSK